MNATSLLKVFGICYLMLLPACQGQGPVEEEPYFDKDIPPSESVDASNGVWSPGGTQIAFQYDAPLTGEPDAGKLDQLWIYDTETEECWKVLDGRVLNIDCSPDGEWFVFHSYTDPEFIFKVRKDGTELTRLTGEGSPNDLEYTSVARWSPDSSRILFTVVAREPRGVSLMNPDGTEIEQLTEGEGIAQRPEWHPEEQTILFTRFIPNVSDRMYLLDVQSRQVEPVFPAN